MTDAKQLLAEYVESGSESAFRELVTRYTDLVYSVALRFVNDRQLAEDIAQSVFIDLARTAQKLSPEIMLGGWLHRHTCFMASKAIRSERRRQDRERQVRPPRTGIRAGHSRGKPVNPARLRAS